MRLTDFRELLYAEFGTLRGDTLMRDHRLGDFGVTGDQAIESGVDPRDVWRALCMEFDVPRSRW
ncbi:Protein of uncharacterised function (DUF3046) (plasmid) [Tsukamurella tyrosinosolvens]|uniref:DUF3046 domain-containing protein n=1 Tax=Tsukamurella tyrosinosolvens TaxID=57704 RepID=A0A1H4S511_TSUTY|nr:DUF3046 domain-containing protein [Tsukamurella tyrosinosolvens]AUN40231.1 hypothetical protein ASU32_09640 [Tsukamurella tyrosinosolvens]KXO93556.1 hypothetical protein AXK58_17220 [Tsukamurella tyrosinosolvens]MEC4614154.1 DUF3046 domain-containing protein [Tsukamurella tyrosinosolvens]RDB46114.1 DUF3046 domain-containing protein [Tsukamurella tyrosinosolvens]SEC39285.1 Protein of unknown function [Tsukamurella tyrosinosolvens]